jgi:phosphatidylglycerol:prolipoprotein diacylglycerol transferase
MFPVINLAGLRIWTWGLMNALATLSAAAISLHETRYRRVDPSALLRMWPWVVISAAVGAHLYYLAAVRGGIPSLRDVVRLMEGTAIQGGMIGGVLAALIYMKWRRLGVMPSLDVCAPAAAFAHGVTRLGCFAAGCCYGKPTSLPWAVVFTKPISQAPIGVPLHPAQLYESALDFLLAVLLHASLKKDQGPDGKVFWKYIVGYSLIRFCVQFYRDDDAGHLIWGLAHSQFMAAGMFLLGAVLLLKPSARPSSAKALPRN